MGLLRPIGDLLTQRFRSGDEGPAMYAAAVVAAMNTALISRWPASDAQALSFSRGSVVIRASHGAIAGFIFQQQSDLLRECNQALAKQFPRLHHPATAIVTRVNSSQ